MLIFAPKHLPVGTPPETCSPLTRIVTLHPGGKLEPHPSCFVGFLVSPLLRRRDFLTQCPCARQLPLPFPLPHDGQIPIVVQSAANGVTIDVVSVDSDACDLENLGAMADVSGGTVTRVKASELTSNFAGILSNPILASQVCL